MDPRLYRAAASGDVQLLDGVADEDLLSQSPQKNTVLHIAATLGHADFTRAILTRCRNTQLLRMPNSNDDTSLHCAARAGRSEIVRILMDFESPTTTAAHDDVEAGGLSSSSVGLLRMQNKEGDTALHEALRNQHQGIAIGMVRKDPKLAFVVDNAQKSSLHVAANEEMEQFVKEILDSNTSELTAEDRRELIRMQDNNGRTGLHYAAWRNNLKIVGMILRSDDSRHVAYIADENGHTALHVAAAFGMQKSMASLLHRCPDAIDQLDRDGRNVLHIAVLNQRRGIIGWLKKKQLPEFRGLLNGPDKDGNTPIHLSAETGVGGLFWDKRAELHYRNKDGRTAMGLEGIIFCCLPGVIRRGRAYGLPRHMPHVIPIKQPSPETATARAPSNMVLVASLIATVTFAAAFTMPGGYRSSDDKANPGTAVLATEPAFQAFLCFDAIAMCLSIFAIFCYISATRSQRDRSTLPIWGNFLTFTACSCMLFALAAGVFVAIPPEGMRLAKALLVMCSLLSSLLIVPPIYATCTLPNRWLMRRRARKAFTAHTNPEARRVGTV